MMARLFMGGVGGGSTSTTTTPPMTPPERCRIKRDGSTLDDDDGMNQTRRRQIFLFDSTHRRPWTKKVGGIYREGPFF